MPRDMEPVDHGKDFVYSSCDFEKFENFGKFSAGE